MKINKKSTLPEINGHKLKLARESVGLSQGDLAAKLCLSHRHIAELEANQLTIFFSPAHKVQVAKKVGATLGLQDQDYLTRKTIDEQSCLPEPETKLDSCLASPKNFDLSSLAKDQFTKQPKNTKKTIIFVLLAGVASLLIGAQIYSMGYSISYLAQLMGLKKLMLPPTANLEMPTVGGVNPTTNAALSENESKESPKHYLSENCTFQESQLRHYRTSNPSKKGDMVFVLSKEPQSVCVIDNQGKTVLLDLATGDSRSLYGQPPFTIVSSDLSKIDLYFQGWKVKSDAPASRAIRLEEAD